MNREERARLEQLALQAHHKQNEVLEHLLSLEKAARRRRWGWLSRLFRLRSHVRVEREVLDDLFMMERRTLITLMLVETILLYVFAPMLGDGVFVWYGVILTLTLWRYYNGYDYQRHPERNSELVWHQKFVVQSWLTALLFALLALYAMPHLDRYYQLFLFIVIVGVSAGAVKTLSNDHRTAIGYLLILLFPLAVEMILLERRETWILAFLLMLYLATQISILLRAYEQSRELRKARKILEEAEELLYEKQELLQRFFEQASEGIFTYNREMRILDCNHAFLSLFHFRREQVIGHKVSELPDKNLVPILQAAMVEGVGNFRSFYRTLRGHQLWIEAKCSPVYDSEGRRIGGLGLIEDKTREELALEELRHLVSHDTLTSALNRRGFRDYMHMLLKEEAHRRLPSLIFYLDLDQFKRINDVYGHKVGDQILIETAKRLKKLLPKRGELVRLGGDEFALVIPFVSADEERTALIESWVDRIEAALKREFVIEGHSIESGASIGVVFMEPGSDAVEELVQAADISMFHAKRGDGKRYVLYVPKMREHHRMLHAMQNDLKKALKRGGLELFFQPIVRAADRRIVAVEVLVRWRHPQQGFLEPNEFLPMARKFNLIAEIDQWVLEESCARIARWRTIQDLVLPEAFSINIDTRLLLRERFPQMLSELFGRYGIRRGEMILEITEDSLVDNFERARQILSRLEELGMDCAIDDFGTGYSSLSYLKKLSFTILKIDREFVRDVLERIENIFLLRTIIDMGKRLNYRIVIEGIETERQFEVVTGIDRDLECQGYLFGRPMDEEELLERLRRDRAEKTE